jgi:allantoin racemase
MTDELIQERLDFIRQCAQETTEFALYRAVNNIVSIESRYEAELASSEVMRLCKRAEEDGCAAVVVWCADDPGVQAAREIVNIPVVGPGESAMLYAYNLARKFSVLVPFKAQAYLAEELAERSGLSSRLVSVRGVELPVLEMRKNKELLFKRLCQAGKSAICDDKAQALAFCCLGMTGMGKALSEELGVPVLEPAKTAVAFAESLIHLHCSYSKLTYAFPPK